MRTWTIEVPPHLGHAPHESGARDHGRELVDAVLAPAVDGQGSHPPPPLAGDDLAGHGRDRKLLLEGE